LEIEFPETYLNKGVLRIALIVTLNHKQYMELLKLSHKIILIDSSIEAYRVAKRENIIYHIGEFDEAPSILYNAIIDYTSPENILEEKQRSGCDSVKALVVEDYEMNRF